MRFVRLALLALFFAFTPATRAADDPVAALQKGLFEEEANHNLGAAIKAYASVIAVTDEQRKLAATAVFRLGECHRKLGQTNDAVAQYQRVLRDFSDQTNLVTLSRQNLRGLGEPAVPEMVGSAMNAPELSPEARARLREILETELQIAEKFLAEQRKKVEVGIMAPGDEVRFERDVLGLRRQILAVDGLKAPAIRAQWREIITREIGLAEKAAQTEKARLDSGKSVPAEFARLQRDVLALKRELVMFDATPVTDATAGAVAAVDAGATDEEEKEVRRIKAMIKDSPDLINGAGGTGISPLGKAAGDGQLVVARFLLESGADVNFRSGGVAAIPLHRAAGAGHKSMVELLLSHRADVNAQDGEGKTPLYLAVENGFKAVVEVLLANKANVNLGENSGSPPLTVAARRGNLALVESLLAAGADVRMAAKNLWTPLHAAVNAGQPEIVAVLLANGADIEAKTSDEMTPLHSAASKGSRELIQRLLAAKASVDPRNKQGSTPLLLAVAAQNLPAVEALLAGGADPDAASSEGNTPLWQVIRSNPPRTDLARMLLEGKADPNLGYKNGYTPLHAVAADKNNEKAMVALLLEFGARPDVQYQESYRNSGKGYTPLLMAVSENLPEVVQVLLDGKANPNLGREDGNMPLHLALYANSQVMVEALLARGANVEARADVGETPLTLAARQCSKEVVELLLAHQADVNARATDGLTPLHKAVAYDRREAFDLLLAAKADVNATDKNGRTPLDYVRENLRLGGPPAPPRTPPRIPGPLAGGIGAPGVSVPSPLSDRQRDLAAALRERGAVDWAPRPNAITFTRRETGSTELVFERRGTNDFNRYTLFEAIAAKGWMASSVHPGTLGSVAANNWHFPDFSKVNITRRDPATGKIITFAVDVAAKVAAGDCAGDLPLEWGDLIDVPESEHKLGADWPGLLPAFVDPIIKCLTRQVTITVKGRTNTLTRKPEVERCGIASSAAPSGYFYFTAVPFRLSTAVQKSGLLLTSSDTSRVQVRRVDPVSKEKQEWTFDLRQTGNVFDLWLRDGDEIEVPEK